MRGVGRGGCGTGLAWPGLAWATWAAGRLGMDWDCTAARSALSHASCCSPPPTPLFSPSPASPPSPSPSPATPSYDFFQQSPLLGGTQYETEFDFGGTKVFVSTCVVEG